MNLFQPDRCLILAPVDGEPKSLNILKKWLHGHLRVVIQANAERPVVIFD